MRYLIEPSRWLMGRMSLTLKFVVITVMFLSPLLYTVSAFRDLEQTSIDFSTKEQVGLEYVSPAMKVVLQAVIERSETINGSSDVSADLGSAVDELGKIDARLGAEYGTTEGFAKLNADFAALKRDNADLAKSPEAAYERWSSFTGQALALLSKAGDKSNLILDPDLDSFYVMDTVVVKLPNLVDTIGQLEAQAWLSDGAIACAAPQTVPQIVTFGLCTGSGTGLVAGTQDDLKRTIEATKDVTIEPALKNKMETTITAATSALNAAGPVLSDPSILEDAEQVETLRADLRDATKSTVAAATVYHAEATKALNSLFEARIDGFKTAETTVSRNVIPFVLVGFYLFIGFYLAVTGAVKPMLRLLARVETGDLSQRADINTHDELGRLGKALNTTIDGLADKTNRERSILAAVSASSEQLNESSTYLAALSTEMASTAEETAVQAQSVASASETVTSNVTTVAAGIDEMRASVEEISRGASAASSVAGEGVKAAATTSETILKLHEASGEIGKVTDLISSIAKQTNLLALNATIEAARAGDAGKGFAVVANEVKELATESSKAADDIRQRINAIQTVAVEAVTAIQTVGDVISQINEAQTSIAAAVEEQSATTDEIARSINHVVGGINEISQNIGGVAESAAHTASNAHDTQAASGQLAQLAQDLREAQGAGGTQEVAQGDGSVWPVPAIPEITRRPVSAEDRFGAKVAPAPVPQDIWHS